MNIVGMTYDTPFDVTVEIEGKRGITMPVDIYKILFDNKDNLRSYIESLPTVEVGFDVDDMEEGSTASFLSTTHPDFGEIFVFFQLSGDDVVVTAGPDESPERLFSRTLTVDELRETVEYAANLLSN